MAIEPLKRTTKISEDQAVEAGGQEYIVVTDPVVADILKKILKRIETIEEHLKLLTEEDI